MRRRDEEESDDSVLVSSDEELSGDDRSGDDEDGYGSLEDEVREWRESEERGRHESINSTASRRRRMSPVACFLLSFSLARLSRCRFTFYLCFSLTALSIYICTLENKSQLEALAAARAERGIADDDDEEDEDEGDGQNPPTSRLASARDRPPTYDADALRDALDPKAER